MNKYCDCVLCKLYDYDWWQGKQSVCRSGRLVQCDVAKRCFVCVGTLSVVLGG